MLFKSTDLKICERTFFLKTSLTINTWSQVVTVPVHIFNFNAVQLQRKFRNQKHLLPKC